MRYLIFVPLLALSLAACGADADDGKPGTDINIDVVTDEGKPVKASSDGKSGEIAIDIPGFKANIAMPKIKLDADNFDLGKVKLYPGSAVSAMKVERAGKDAEYGTVTVHFDAPATPEVVKAWFLEKLTEQDGFTVAATATNISGTNEDGEPFALEVAPAADGHSSGTISISGH